MSEVSFGKWLKQQRGSRGLTQKQLAHQIGCAAITLRKVEADERRPSAQILDLLSEIFVIPVEERAAFQRFGRGDWTKAPRESFMETPWRASMKAGNNLPAQLTSFIGRENEIEQVRAAIDKYRLVTLLGFGGTGKTRLSLKVADEMIGRFQYIWFVELAALTDPDTIPWAILSAMGRSERKGREIHEAIADYLQDDTTLIILDNCEHLVEATAMLCHSLLKRLPKLRILASSRQALGVPGELTYRIPALSLPDVERSPEPHELMRSEAMRLFIERACLASASFALTKENAASITQICYRLGGIPLAIELGAACIKTLSLADIAKRLDDRFNLLTGGARTLMPRQQTLRATLDWSYNLLSEPERTLLCRLTVFSGSWTMEAAEAVCRQDGDFTILDLMTQLVDQSWVTIQEACNPTRYHMLETTRQYAQENLVDPGERKDLHFRHLKFFVELVSKAEGNLKGPDQAMWYDRLDHDLDNLRAALTWFEGSENAELRLRLAAGLWRYWKNRGHSSDGSKYLKQILDGLPPGPVRHTTAYAKALTAAGSLAYYEGNISYSEQSRVEALAIFRNLNDKVGIADCLIGLGNTAISKGDYESSHNFYQESLVIRREIGDKWGVARLLGNLGLLAYFKLDYIQAVALHTESLALFRELQDEEGVVNELVNLGDVFYSQTDLVAANTFYMESTIIAQKLKDQWGLTYALKGMADVNVAEGDLSTALSRYRECLVLLQKGAGYAGLPFVLESIANLACVNAEFERAVRLLGAANTVRQNTNSPLPFPNQKAYDTNLAISKQQLDRPVYDHAWAEGSAMTMEQALCYALGN